VIDGFGVMHLVSIEHTPSLCTLFTMSRITVFCPQPGLGSLLAELRSVSSRLALPHTILARQWRETV
jgi:hypothetical protein